MIAAGDGSANGALTITLAGVSGKFHAIRRVSLYRTATIAVVGTGTLTITTTNLPATLGWSVGNAITVGSTMRDVDEYFEGGNLISSAASTDTTFVMPAPGLGVTWHGVVHYDVTPTQM